MYSYIRIRQHHFYILYYIYKSYTNITVPTLPLIPHWYIADPSISIDCHWVARHKVLTYRNMCCLKTHNNDIPLLLSRMFHKMIRRGDPTDFPTSESPYYCSVICLTRNWCTVIQGCEIPHKIPSSTCCRRRITHAISPFYIDGLQFHIPKRDAIILS